MRRQRNRGLSSRRAAQAVGACFETMEHRVLFATTPPAPVAPPIAPPPPKTGIVLNKGVLLVGGEVQTANTIKVALSTDAKTINVTLNGKNKSFLAVDVADVLVAGGQKNDQITVFLGATKLKHPARVLGLDGNDTITTGKERDLIFAGKGNDSVTSGAGDDVVIAGPGKDVIHTGDGADVLFGDKDDLLDGGAGKNEIHLPPPPPAAGT